MKKTKTPQTPQLQEPDTQSKRRLSLPKVAYSAFLCVMMSMMFCQPAYAATDVWTKAKEIMQDVYTQILAISTIAAIVTASVPDGRWMKAAPGSNESVSPGLSSMAWALSWRM